MSDPKKLLGIAVIVMLLSGTSLSQMYFSYYNHFLYPCNSSSQCMNTLYQSCNTKSVNQTDCWFCDCYFGGQPCMTNEDCCTNNCTNNGTCSVDGGLQGTVCINQLSICAPGYVCRLCGLFGYCDAIIQTTTTTNFITKLTSPASPTARVTATPTIPLVNCTGVPDGDYANPLDPCSNVFYTCANGRAYVRQCPSNLKFDQQEDMCLPEYQVPDCYVI